MLLEDEELEQEIMAALIKDKQYDSRRSCLMKLSKGQASAPEELDDEYLKERG